MRATTLVGSAALAGLGAVGFVMGTRARRERLTAARAVVRLSQAQRTEGSGYAGLSRGEMQRVQALLVQLGYDPGPIDGVYGPLTADAVAAFQARQGLVEDGEPGSETRARLEEVAATEREEAEQDECDPLLEPPVGRVCAWDGRRYVLLEEARERTDVLPSIETDQVGFSRDYTRYVEGPSWRFVQLDRWLKAEFDDRRLVTVYRPDLVDDWFRAGDSDWTWKASVATLALTVAMPPVRAFAFVVAVGRNYGAYLQHEQALSAEHEQALSESAARALAGFAASHNVKVEGVGYVPINNLPDTEAARAFVEHIAGYIARFQSSQF